MEKQCGGSQAGPQPCEFLSWTSLILASVKVCHVSSNSTSVYICTWKLHYRGEKGRDTVLRFLAPRCTQDRSIQKLICWCDASDNWKGSPESHRKLCPVPCSCLDLRIIHQAWCVGGDELTCMWMSISLDGVLSKMLKLNKRMLSSLDLFPFFFLQHLPVFPILTQHEFPLYSCIECLWLNNQWTAKIQNNDG